MNIEALGFMSRYLYNYLGQDGNKSKYCSVSIEALRCVSRYLYKDLGQDGSKSKYCSVSIKALGFMSRGLYNDLGQDRSKSKSRPTVRRCRMSYLPVNYFTFVYINLNRAFVIIVLFPNNYSSKKVCANGIGK